MKSLEAHIGPGYHRQIWAHAYATPAVTEAEAREAVEVMPRYEPLPSFYWFADTYGAIGRTLALAGRPEAARPYLERATRRCFARDPRNFAALGAVLQAGGNRDGACKAYGEVVARWGQATARSLSLERARRGIADLQCAQP